MPGRPRGNSAQFSKLPETEQRPTYRLFAHAELLNKPLLIINWMRYLRYLFLPTYFGR